MLELAQCLGFALANTFAGARDPLPDSFPRVAGCHAHPATHPQAALLTPVGRRHVPVLLSFRPAGWRSGSMFDPRRLPRAGQVITALLPGRYFVTLLQTLFLAGNIWSVILPNAAVLAGRAIALLALAVRMTRKRIA